MPPKRLTKDEKDRIIGHLAEMKDLVDKGEDAVERRRAALQRETLRIMELGVSGRELSRRLGVTHPTVLKWASLARKRREEEAG